jgi:hypothetical protein
MPIDSFIYLFNESFHKILKVYLNGPGGVAYLGVIAPAYKTKDPGFESRQGVRFLGIHTLQSCCHNLVCIVIVCRYLRKKIKKGPHSEAPSTILYPQFSVTRLPYIAKLDIKKG